MASFDLQIRLHSLKYYKSHRTLLNQISLGAKKGELVALLGPNGVGKSTLLELILGTYEKDDFWINDFDGSYLASELNGQAFLVGQKLNLPFDMNVSDVLGFQHWMKRTDQNKIEDQLKLLGDPLGVFGMLNRNFRTLSQGESARVLLSRGLLTEKNILLVDETLGSMDLDFQFKAIQAMKKWVLPNRIIIWISHTWESAFEYSDRVWLLDRNSEGAMVNPRVEPVKDVIQRIFEVKKTP